MKEQHVERASRIATLIVKRMQESLSPEEHAELEAWLREDSRNYLLFEELMDEENLQDQLEEMQSIEHERAYERLSAQFFPAAPEMKRPARRIKFWFYAAAAVAVVAIGFSVLWKSPGTKPLAKRHEDLLSIKPGGKKATLTLADGSTIDLGQHQDGIVAREGNYIIQLGGSGNLYYRTDENTSAPDIASHVNVLSVPRGGEYSVTLEDGTQVWLNSVSTLRFPVHFSSRERRVYLTGEGYFKVAKEAKPFIVDVNGVEVRALGTEFNISAYPEEKKMHTTLVNGVVRVTKGEQSALLSPGKKAEIGDTGHIAIYEPDVEELIAWKKGEFHFQNTPLVSILNQLMRWYDVDIRYPERIPDINFTGGFRRADGIDKIIRLIEMTGEVTFRAEGRVIDVYPG